MSDEPFSDVTFGEAIAVCAQTSVRIEHDGNDVDDEVLGEMQTIVGDLRRAVDERGAEQLPNTVDFLDELQPTLDAIETGTATQSERETAVEQIDTLGQALLMSAMAAM